MSYEGDAESSTPVRSNPTAPSSRSGFWSRPAPVPPCTHRYKYSLFYGYPGRRVVGYDNERGKGDHKHVAGVEEPYVFTSIKRLLDDWAADVLRQKG